MGLLNGHTRGRTVPGRPRLGPNRARSLEPEAGPPGWKARVAGPPALIEAPQTISPSSPARSARTELPAAYRERAGAAQTNWSEPGWPRRPWPPIRLSRPARYRSATLQRPLTAPTPATSARHPLRGFRPSGAAAQPHHFSPQPAGRPRASPPGTTAPNKSAGPNITSSWGSHSSSAPGRQRKAQLLAASATLGRQPRTLGPAIGPSGPPRGVRCGGCRRPSPPESEGSSPPPVRRRCAAGGSFRSGVAEGKGLLNLSVVRWSGPDGWYDRVASPLASKRNSAEPRQGGARLGVGWWPEPVEGRSSGRSSAPVRVRAVANGHHWPPGKALGLGDAQPVGAARCQAKTRRERVCSQSIVLIRRWAL